MVPVVGCWPGDDRCAGIGRGGPDDLRRVSPRKPLGPRATKFRAAPPAPVVAPTPNPVFMAGEPHASPLTAAAAAAPPPGPYVADSALPNGVTLQRATFRERLAHSRSMSWSSSSRPSRSICSSSAAAATSFSCSCLPRRVLGGEGHDDRRHHLSAPSPAHRRPAIAARRRVHSRACGYPLRPRRRARIPLDAEGA